MLNNVFKRIDNFKLYKVPQKQNILNRTETTLKANRNLVPFSNNIYFGVPIAETATAYKFLKAIIPKANGNIYFLNLNVLSTKNK